MQPGSRADEAGLRPRDIILEVNREAVKDIGSYQQAMTAGGKSRIVLILVKRGDSTIYFALKAGSVMVQARRLSGSVGGMTAGISDVA